LAKRIAIEPTDRLARPLHYTDSVPAANHAAEIGKIGMVSCCRNDRPQLVVAEQPQRLPGRDKPVAENRHNAFDFTAQPRALLPPCWADQSGQPAQEDDYEV
jgi:hypothetical protein